MAQRPRILIPTPTGFDEAYNQQCWPEYAAAVTSEGGIPVRVPLTHSVREVQAMLTDAEGILLPGSGADVDPQRYGHARDQACAEPDPRREQTDYALLEAAELQRLPLLGICFGLQSLNAFHGGTLIQDLAPVPVNHSAGRAVHDAHTVQVTEGSRLHSLIGGANAGEGENMRIAVNSSHHQAVGGPGDTLRIAAKCPHDAVIEAVESSDPGRWLVGVQWHPERTLHSSAPSQQLFRAFLSACSTPRLA